MDNPDPQVGIQDPLYLSTSIDTSSPGHEQLCSGIREVSCVGCPDFSDAHQAGYSGSTGTSLQSGILQPYVSSTQVHGRMEADYRPQSPEQVHSSDAFSHGDTEVYQGFPSKGGFSHFNRPEGRIFSYPHSSIITALPSVPVAANGIPVQGSMLWPVHSSTRLYPSLQDGVQPGPLGRHQTVPISGRLAGGGIDLPSGSRSNEMGGRALQAVGVADQLREVRPSTLESGDVSGYADRYGTILSTSHTGAYTEVQRRSTIVLRRDKVEGFPVSQVVRPYGLTREADSLCKNQNQADSILPQGPMDASAGLCPQSSRVSGPETGSPVVVGRVQSPHRATNSRSSSRPSSVHRRVAAGLGCSPQRPRSPGTVVSGGEAVAHQRLGVKGSLSRTQGVSAGHPGVDSSGHDGQHHSGGLRQEPRGHTVSSTDRHNSRDAELVTAERHHTAESTHTGPAERQGRSTEPSGSSSSRRVVASSKGLSSPVEALGSTSRGPIRHKSKLKASAILFPVPGRSSTGDRRSVTGLGRDDGVRLSSLLTDTIGSQKDRRLKKPRHHSRRSSLANTVVVPSTSGVTGGQSSQAPRSTEAAKAGREIPLQHPSAQPTRLEIVQRARTKAGFSAKAASRMAGAVRTSTSSLYQSKWSVFSSWCSGRKVDPLTASLPLIADFLLFLRDVKKFTLPTIKGYRTALALVLKPAGVDVSSSTDITALIRAFSLEKPPRDIRPPCWDLAVVLGSLLQPPYEPLDQSSMMFLTHKTAFLLALASAKRVSELQAILGTVLHTEDWSSLTLQTDPNFLAKTQRSFNARNFSSLIIPALSQLVGPRGDDLGLCPVRAVKIYLQRTKILRGKDSRLFLPVIGKRKFVSKNTISAWICATIKHAYSSLTDAHKDLHVVRAHEVRAIATSWHFAHNLSLEAVMSAASWRSHSTFSSFYLRDVSLMKDDTYALGPLVVAQSVVGTPTADATSHANPRLRQVSSTATTVPAPAVCQLRGGGCAR